MVGLACGATLLSALQRGYEGPWYPLSTIIHQPTAANPAFGYRLLFPKLALLAQAVFPSLTDRQAFYAVQVLAIAMAMYFCGEWARLFMPRLGRHLGYLLLAVILPPTIGYFTFYDIAIVGFWAACLWLLYHQHWVIYLIVFGISTLNHENNLILVPIAVLYRMHVYSARLRVARLVLFAVVQLLLYTGLRYAVVHMVPGNGLWDNRLVENLLFWRTYSLRDLMQALIALVPWWLLAAAGWPHAPVLLRYSCLALPGLFVVTTLFGKFNEARQFDAFIPTTIGLIACFLQDRVSRGEAGTHERCAP